MSTTPPALALIAPSRCSLVMFLGRSGRQFLVRFVSGLTALMANSAFGILELAGSSRSYAQERC